MMASENQSSSNDALDGDNDCDSHEKTPTGPINPFVKLVVVPLAAIWVVGHDGTAALLRKTYKETNQLSVIVGILLAIGAGIATGYHHGFVVEGNPPWRWLAYGLGMAAATFVYAWPMLFLVLFKYTFHVSEKLRDRVNIDGRHSYGDARPVWFTGLLLGLAALASACALFWMVYHGALLVQPLQANVALSWTGALLSIAAGIVVLVLAICFIVLVFAEFWIAVLVAVVAAGLHYLFGASLNELASGAQHALRGNGPWGTWGYVTGGFVGLILGGIVFCVSSLAIHLGRLRVIALVSGVAAVGAFSVQTAGLVGAIKFAWLGPIAPGLLWIAYGTQLLLWCGFVFPGLHIIISRCGLLFVELEDLLEAVYGENPGGYREFFLQVANIAIVGVVAWHLPVWMVAGGVTSTAALYALTAMAMVLGYALLGKILDWAGSAIVSLGVAIYVGKLAYLAYVSHALWFGNYGGGIAAVAAAAASFFCANPLAYLAVRFVAEPMLSRWLRTPLLNLHRLVCDLPVILFDILEGAADKAYQKSKYAQVFLHLFNIVLLLPEYFAFRAGLRYLQFDSWLAVGVTITTMWLVYFVLGRLLQKYGTVVVGLLSSVALAIAVGAYTLSAQPYGYFVAVPVGLVAAALQFGLGFPVLFLLSEAVGVALGLEKWLLSAIERLHGSFRGVFGGIRRELEQACALVRGLTENIRAQVGQAWRDTVAYVRNLNNQIRDTVASVRSALRRNR